MKRFICYGLFFLVLLPQLVSSQTEPVDTAMVAKIREEGMNRSQISMIAHQITDVAGPRLTNSPGYKRAANWAVSQMKQWGLSNAGLEAWGDFGKGWELQKSYIAIKSPYYQPMIAYPRAWTGSTNGLITAPVVFLEKMDSATITKHAAEIKGAIVLVSDGTKKIKSAFNAYASRYTDSQLVKMGDMYWFTRKMVDFYLPMIENQKKIKAYLVAQGPVALLLEEGGGRDGTIFVDGGSEYKKDLSPGKTSMVLSTEDFLRLQRLVEGGTKVQVEMEVKTNFDNADLHGHNVVGEIPGTDPSLKSELVI